ncbi:putative Gag polyprotein [Cricetulus griseus]|nr:putative Gag polyprotein [Cricetulus griseus]
MTEDHNRVEHIYNQIETRICSVSDTLDARIANNQHRIGDLAQTIRSMSDISTVTGQKLESRIGYLEGNAHAIQRLSKEENIKGLEAHSDEEIRKLNNSMTFLEPHRIHEIQALRETVVARLKAWADSERDSLQSDAPTPLKHQENSPKVVMHIPLVFPATMIENPPSKKHPNGQMAYQWELIKLKDLKRIKELVVSYGLHSPYVKELLCSWATFNSMTPTDWERLVSAVFENSSQIQWRAQWREEKKASELQGIKKGYEATQDKILGESIYADPQVQAGYDDHILSLCRTAALNAWDKIRESGERVETYTEIEQGLTEQFPDFFKDYPGQ